MIKQFKAKMFPCTEMLNMVISENCQAADRLIRVCSPKDMHGNSLIKPIFPALKAGQIVNPR
jgi:hypothetical protein